MGRDADESTAGNISEGRRKIWADHKTLPFWQARLIGVCCCAWLLTSEAVIPKYTGALGTSLKEQ